MGDTWVGVAEKEKAVEDEDDEEDDEEEGVVEVPMN